MIKTNITAVLGIAMLSIFFVPRASAGCGKALVSSRSVVFSEALARAGSFEASAMAGPADTLRPGDENATSAARNPVGLWLSNVTLGGQGIYQAFESFTSDGLEFLNDNGAPQAGNVCFGVWTSVGRNTVRVYHPSWSYDASGNVNGTVVIKEQLTLDPSGNSFTGTVVVDTYDLNGKVAAPELRAQISGKRVTGE